MSLSVRAVERALDILLSFSDEESTRSLTQIAESVHLSKPTVHRLLATLEKKHFVAKDKIKGRYRLDVRFYGQPENPLRSQKDVDNRNVVVDFVAPAIPKNSQTSLGFNRIGAHQARSSAWK